MPFDEVLARAIASEYCDDMSEEKGLIEAFVQVCAFLSDNPNRLSRGNFSLESSSGLHHLAKKYYSAYRRSDFPIPAGTIPDEMVILVMMEAFGYSEEQSARIKIEHQRAMMAENCVGALLERYLDSVLRPQGWHWCCGSFVKAVDFIRRDENESWLALQIKNRDNSENSSSSAIRNGTPIQKWFRSYSRSGKTNWDRLPPLMQGFNLSEHDFMLFVRQYLHREKLKHKS